MNQELLPVGDDVLDFGLIVAANDDQRNAGGGVEQAVVEGGLDLG